MLCPRTLGESPREAHSARAGTLHDEAFVLEVTRGADALLVATPGRSQDDGRKLLDAVPTLITAARKNGARIGVVGGAGW